ncbi:MAG TPA: imelysin family protein, partial [Micropepsaceae bacterium]|nr:imelysin family protein [Micropepsaceae bacterium]
RAAWVAARPAYLVTETFRFYDGPIEEVEGFINAWPLNEGFIDATEGAPQGGIIHDASATIDEDTLRNRNQTSDEADVTTGWHAIEFLLWGQDFSATGPGTRPFTDYTAGTSANDRRRAYLALVTKLLIDDLRGLVAAWDPAASGNHAEEFRALPPREAVGRMVNGMAVLAGFETASERLSVALESGDQEDEHSCFSDTTKQDFVFDLQGIENVWRGTYPGVSGTGLEALVRGRDAALADRINGLFADAKARIADLDEPWDQVLAQAPGSPARAEAEAAVSALIALAKALKDTSPVLGVIVQVEGL